MGFFFRNDEYIDNNNNKKSQGQKRREKSKNKKKYINNKRLYSVREIECNKRASKETKNHKPKPNQEAYRSLTYNANKIQNQVWMQHSLFGYTNHV